MSTSYGLDTNVLLRALLSDDDAQGKKARDFLKKNCSVEHPGFINHMVLCELAWTLKAAYKFSRQQIGDVILRILQTKELEVDRSLTVWAALRQFETGGADFADYLIGQFNRELGYVKTATFDREAGKSNVFMVL